MGKIRSILAVSYGKRFWTVTTETHYRGDSVIGIEAQLIQNVFFGVDRLTSFESTGSPNVCMADDEARNDDFTGDIDLLDSVRNDHLICRPNIVYPPFVYNQNSIFNGLSACAVN